MNRRDLLAGLALASLEASAQTRPAGAAAESLYIPKPQLVKTAGSSTISWTNSRSSIW